MFTDNFLYVKKTCATVSYKVKVKNIRLPRADYITGIVGHPRKKSWLIHCILGISNLGGNVHPPILCWSCESSNPKNENPIKSLVYSYQVQHGLIHLNLQNANIFARFKDEWSR
jgi:hypothetical protein